MYFCASDRFETAFVTSEDDFVQSITLPISKSIGCCTAFLEVLILGSSKTDSPSLESEALSGCELILESFSDLSWKEAGVFEASWDLCCGDCGKHDSLTFELFALLEDLIFDIEVA